MEENNKHFNSDGLFNKYGEDLTDLSKMSSHMEGGEESLNNGMFNKYDEDFTDLSETPSEQHSNDTRIVILNKRRCQNLNKIWSLHDKQKIIPTCLQ